MKNGKKLLGAGLITAIGSSLCCIAPLLALISGTTGVASTFSWMEPFRPYLIIFTVLVLGYAWYNKLKPSKNIDCHCETEQNSSFFQSKLFLGIITLFAISMTLIPYYSKYLYPNNKTQVVVNQSNIMQKEFIVKGLTCASCEQHIDHTLQTSKGIISSKTSYPQSKTMVKYDSTIIDINTIKQIINKTGYNVK